MIEHVKFAIMVLRNDRRGVTALEYAMIAGVLVIALITAFTTLGGKITTLLGSVGTSI